MCAHVHTLQGDESSEEENTALDNVRDDEDE